MVAITTQHVVAMTTYPVLLVPVQIKHSRGWLQSLLTTDPVVLITTDPVVLITTYHVVLITTYHAVVITRGYYTYHVVLITTYLVVVITTYPVVLITIINPLELMSRGRAHHPRTTLTTGYVTSTHS